MKEEGAQTSKNAMAGARKRVNCKLFDEQERSVKGKWALSSLIYVDESALLLFNIKLYLKYIIDTIVSLLLMLTW